MCGSVCAAKSDPDYVGIQEDNGKVALSVGSQGKQLDGMDIVVFVEAMVVC